MSRRSLRKAWSDAWYSVSLMLIDHIPLVLGVAVVAGIHLARELYIPTDSSPWTRLIDGVLLVSEGTVFLSLVVAPAFDLMSELAERVSVAIFRLRMTQRTGRRLPKGRSKVPPATRRTHDDTD